MSRYSNTGLHRAEALFQGAHERAGQYLDQAPILVMWALPWVSSGDESASTFARLWIAAKCEDGPPLKVMLRDSGFTAPMRQIHEPRVGVGQVLGAGVCADIVDALEYDQPSGANLVQHVAVKPGLG